MTALAFVVAAAEGGGPGRLGLDALAAVVGIVVALAGAWATVVKVLHMRREQVSGDERQAREARKADATEARADWQALVAQKDRDIAARDAHIGRLEVERDRYRVRMETLEQDQADARVSAMGHVGWDFQAVEELSRLSGGRSPLPPPPPIFPPRIAPPPD